MLLNRGSRETHGGELSDHDLGELGKSAAAYERIRTLVIEGLLRPRQRLNPADLAKLLKISATPIREALARLASEGYIASEAHRGFFAKPLSVAEQRDLCLMLFMLERGSVEQGIQTFTIDGLDTPDLDFELVLFSERLHGRIALLSQNMQLRRTVQLIVNRTHQIRVLRFEDMGLLRKIRDDKLALLESLQSHNGPRAIELLQHGLEQKLAMLPDLVERANERASEARPL
jgi:DNA-binding GntR family transcriptional regulator